MAITTTYRGDDNLIIIPNGGVEVQNGAPLWFKMEVLLASDRRFVSL
jgi:hypothetical protein